MSAMSRRPIACALVLLALTGAPVTGASSPVPSELVSAAREYRASLADLLPFREDAVAHARERLATRRQLVEDGLIARREADAGARPPRLRPPQRARRGRPSRQPGGPGAHDLAARARRVVPRLPRRRRGRSHGRARAHRRAVPAPRVPARRVIPCPAP